MTRPLLWMFFKSSSSQSCDGGLTFLDFFCDICEMSMQIWDGANMHNDDDSNLQETYQAFFANSHISALFKIFGTCMRWSFQADRFISFKRLH